VYGVNVQNLLTSKGSRRVKLIERCGSMPAAARATCYEWLGTALAVVTNGRFRELGCPFISRAGRDACRVGALRMDEALVSFS
jgi:hypothetical protein